MPISLRYLVIEGAKASTEGEKKLEEMLITPTLHYVGSKYVSYLVSKYGSAILKKILKSRPNKLGEFIYGDYERRLIENG